MPKSPDAGGQTLDVERSMLDVGCSAPLKPWLLLQSGPGNPALNMALDEALLEAVSRLGRPVLRFYGWTEPAATFGYFQKYAGVECATLLRPLIRRPTGGGIVPHDADWTYSLAFPPGHEWHSLKAEESYRRVHEWIQSAFAQLEVATNLAPDAHITGPGQCFAGYEKFDLLWQGRKIAGAAQRRNKLGLLIQGSVQPSTLRSRTTAPVLRSSSAAEDGEDGPPISLARSDWQMAMCAVGKGEFGVEWLEFEPDNTLWNRAEYLVRHKYLQMEFIRKR
jgi:lipoate-protein ligase A